MMIAHVAEFAAPAGQRTDSGMRGFRERVIPQLQLQPGFTGYLILSSRERGRSLGVTLWGTEEDARLAGARLEQERRTGTDEPAVLLPIPELYDVLVVGGR